MPYVASWRRAVNSKQEAVQALFGTSNAVWRIETRHESFLLLLSLYKKFPDLRETLCEQIVAGPPRGLFDEKVTQERIDSYVFEILSALHAKDPALPAAAHKRLEVIRAAYPEWKASGHEGMSQWMEVGWVGRRVDAESLKSLAAETILEFIESFKPQWKTSLRDLCEAIGVRISQEPEWGFIALKSISEGIEGLPGDALNPILWGMRATLSDKSTKLDSDSASRLIDILAELVGRSPIPQAWSSLPSLIKDIAEVFKLPAARWDAVGKRLQLLFSDFDFERSESEQKVRWLDRAINHPYGDLTQLYLKLAQDHVNELSAVGQPLTMESRSQDFLDRMYESYGLGSRYGYTLVSERLAWMEAVAPVFAERMREWFDWKEHQERSRVVWSGYFWSRTLSRALVSDFESTYEIAAQHHDDFAESERDGLASHLAAVFWFHPELAARLPHLAARIDSDIRLKILHGWKHHLESATPDAAVAFFDGVILPYWDWCATQRFFSDAGGQRERFGFWQLLSKSYAAFPRAVRKALERTPAKSDSVHLIVDELVKDFMLQYPEELVDLLRAWLDILPYPSWHEKEWRKVWETLQEAKPRNLAKLENEMARRGLDMR
jgi:hypothetical protein